MAMKIGNVELHMGPSRLGAPDDLRKVIIDFIDGEFAILNSGPDTGTVVVSVGAAELYGVEFGVGN